MRKKHLLTECLIASIGLHAIAIWVFYTQPVFLRPYLNTILGKSGPETVIPLEEEDINLSEKNIALEDLFNQIVILSPHLQKPYDFEQEISLEAEGTPLLEPIFESTDFGLIANLPEEKKITESPIIPTPALSLPTEIFNEPLVTNNSISPITPRLSYDKEPHLDYIRELQLLTALATFDTENHTPKIDVHFPASPEAKGVKPAIAAKEIQPPALSLDTQELVALASPDKLMTSPPAFTHKPIASNFIAPLTTAPHLKVAKASSLPPLSAYGFPDVSYAVEWNDDFEVDVRFVEREEGGYLFSLALIPKYDLNNERMKQNYYFLIDRSNSIEKHRYQTFKRAVAKALTTLHKDDSFNIIIFDSKITKLSENPLPNTKKSIQLAEDFLEKQQHGSYFAATDIYSALSKIVPSEVPDQEANTAILITDGDSTLHPEKQRKLIQTWLEKNNSKVSLYTACVGEGNNKTLLDLLSSLSRGSLLYSDTHTSFPRKLAKLVIDLRHPIAKDMMLSIVQANASSGVKLYPASAYLPYLLSDHPYVIFGTANKLSDFTVLLEGRNKNRALSIKKTISFEKAKQDSRFLAQKWKTTQAHEYYEKYLEEGQITLLQKAESLFKNDQSPRSRR